MLTFSAGTVSCSHPVCHHVLRKAVSLVSRNWWPSGTSPKNYFKSGDIASQHMVSAADEIHPMASCWPFTVSKSTAPVSKATSCSALVPLGRRLLLQPRSALGQYLHQTMWCVSCPLWTPPLMPSTVSAGMMIRKGELMGFWKPWQCQPLPRNSPCRHPCFPTGSSPWFPITCCVSKGHQNIHSLSLCCYKSAVVSKLSSLRQLLSSPCKNVIVVSYALPRHLWSVGSWAPLQSVHIMVSTRCRQPATHSILVKCPTVGVCKIPGPDVPITHGR